MKAVSINTLNNFKGNGEKFACVTAYDASFAAALCAAEVDVILVGDSLGMVLQGHDCTLPVTVEQMVYHVECVARGNNGALVIADMPFMSYSSTDQAACNATALMQAGAHMIKMEGGTWLSNTITHLNRQGIPVCAHLGLTPQSVNTLGGYRVQGRGPAAAAAILADARAIEAAGASMLVLECVPAALARQVTEQLTIPVIGIGAGPHTDAQVLVLHDLLGLNPAPARFVRDFMAGNASIAAALESYGSAVKTGAFPAPEHCFE